MDGGVSPGAAEDRDQHSLPLLPPQGWWCVFITHLPHGHGGLSLMNPVSITSQLLSLFSRCWM